MSSLTAYAANLQADAMARALDGGYLRVYEGERVLSEMRFAEPSAAAARDGVLEFSLRADESALATGTPDNFKAVTRSGAPVIVGSVGVAGADLLVKQSSIVRGARVSGIALRHKVLR
jgi:hypothetical protein